MTTVTFFKQGDLILGFTVYGHSDYAEEGEDIVCSAISSATIMTANTITDVLKIKANVTVGDGSLELELPQNEAEKADAVMQGLLLHMNALKEQYSKHIKLKFSEV